ncbi:MAG: alpha/beta fold hydrolase [Betaproteobacteria bacterium]
MSQTLSLPFNSTIVRVYLSRFATRVGVSLAAAFAPAWMARKASQWFITPPRIVHTPRELQTLTHGTRLSITSPMGKLAGWRFGHPAHPAIIASHGWGGRGAQFREFVPALTKAGYQVLLFDHVSHGYSEGSEAPITDFAKGVSTVAKHAESQGIRIAGFIGHSLGCAGIGIALRHDLQHLKDIRVVQIAPPASLIRYSRFFAKTLGLSERIRAAMQWRLEQKIGVQWTEFEMPRAAASLTAKALVIHDQLDRDVRIENGLSVARAWPDARFKRTFGLGHRKVLRDSAVITAAVDFLQDRVQFSRPPEVDQWSLAFAAQPGVAALF